MISFNLKQAYFFLFSFFFVLSYLNCEDNFLYLFFILFYFGYLFLFKKQKVFKQQMIFLLVFIFVFNLPWILRNLIFARELVFLSKQGGIGIALGHMYDYPIYDDLRCPYLTDMFSFYSNKLKESGSGLGAALYFVGDLFRKHNFIEINKFYITKIVNMFKEALLLIFFPIGLGFYTINTTFINIVHKIFIRCAILAIPLLWIYRRKISPYFIYIIFLFLARIFVALLIFGCPRYGYNVIPYMIILTSFTILIGLKLIFKLVSFIKDIL